MVWEDIKSRYMTLLGYTTKIPAVGLLKDAFEYWLPTEGVGQTKFRDAWSKAGKGVEDLLGVSTDYWLNTTAELLTGFGVPADQANRVARTLSKMVPDIPGLKQLLLMMYPVTFALTIFPKAFGSVGEVMD
ncbi:unnamed protein product, partial [marine sediment metagenome]